MKIEKSMQTYLNTFILPSEHEEHEFMRTKYELANADYYYPFKFFFHHQMNSHHHIEFNFEPLTIFYGSNGSGKTTLLNIIAEKLALNRKTAFNQSPYFYDYVGLCLTSINHIPNGSMIITSDDIFDYVLDVRHINQGINQHRKNLIAEHNRYTYGNIKSLEDFESIGTDKIKQLKKHKSRFSYLQANKISNIKEQSNGESALFYFHEKIKEHSLYLLDEPENSLSPDKQLELMAFLLDSVRFYGCQFIIATHSPFLLSLPTAKIYDLDSIPIKVKNWTQLDNIQTYYRFFKERENEFLI